MYRVRRDDRAPRVEMTPLIDVIFLLLTFFMYSVVTMAPSQMLPVRLTSAPGAASAGGAITQVVTLDAAGGLRWNDQAVDGAELDRRLTELAAEPGQPTLFIAMERAADGAAAVDRGPLVPFLVERITAAGIRRFVFVGSPTEGRPTPDAAAAGAAEDSP